MDGLQVIVRMATSQCGKNLPIAGWPVRRKNAAGCVGKTHRSADVRCRMVSAGTADVCIAGNLSSTAMCCVPDYALSVCSRAVKRSPHFPDAATVQRSGVGFCRLQRVPQPTAAQLADIALASAETCRPSPEKSRAWRCCRFPVTARPSPLRCQRPAGDRNRP